MSRQVFWPCLKCGAPATRESADTESPLCWAHGGGDPPEVDGDPEPTIDDFDTQLQAEDSYLNTNGERIA